MLGMEHAMVRKRKDLWEWHVAIKPVADCASDIMNSVNKTDKNWNARFSSQRAVFFGMLFYISFILASVLSLIYFQVTAQMAIDTSLLQMALLKTAFILWVIGLIGAWFFALYYDRFRLSQMKARLKTQRLKAKIAEYSETDRALQEAKAAAEAANQAKSRYLSGISHELRSPLNSLLGYAQLLEKDNHLSDKHRESVLIIRRSGEYLADLIEGLLDISKIEAGRLDILPSEVQFPALLEQIVSMFQLQADKKHIDFSYEFGSKLPEYVRVDEKHLRQILINLLSNAIKFTTQGSVRFTVDYRSETAIFTVEDTGRGIDIEDQERIFDPFEQVHNPDFTAVPGTGLGLTITRLLTEIMGGDISLTSELNKGSVFKVQLLMGSVREPTLIPVSQKDIEGYSGDRKLLMVVDDDPVHRQMMMNILEPIGFTVTEASNAMDCLAKTEQYLPDLFMLDVSMPGMNGLQLARALRDKNIRKPIIFISANVREGDAVQHEDYGQDDYLPKPINIDYLLEKIGAILDLNWRYMRAPIASAASLSSNDFVESDYPPLSDRLTLKGMAEVKYEKGLTDRIDSLEELTLASPAFIRHIRELLKQQQFIEISNLLDR